MFWKNRFVRIGIYFTSLVGLILYGFYFHPGVTLQICLSEPERYDGSVIDVGNEAVVTDIYDDGFSIKQLGKKVRVFGSTKDVAIGEFVVLKATFHKPDQLEAAAVRIAKKRRAKIWLSVFPVIVVFILFFKCFRFDAGTLYFEEK